MDLMGRPILFVKEQTNIHFYIYLLKEMPFAFSRNVGYHSNIRPIALVSKQGRKGKVAKLLADGFLRMAYRSS